MKSAEVSFGGCRVLSQRDERLPDWWVVVPAGEQRFLRVLARMLRSAKRSRSPEVAQAAVKWERALGCFIRVRLVTEKQRAESRKLKWERRDA